MQMKIVWIQAILESKLSILEIMINKLEDDISREIKGKHEQLNTSEEPTKKITSTTTHGTQTKDKVIG